jgi:hypothetical protein
MNTVLNGPGEMVIVRVLTRETIAELRLCASMAEAELDTLPASMRERVRKVVEFVRTLKVSDVIVRSEVHP